MRPQNEKKKKVVSISEAPKKPNIQWTKKLIEDSAGTAIECIILSWTDLAILTTAAIIRFPGFLSYIRDKEDRCYAIFADMYEQKSEQYFAISIGNVRDIIDTYVKTDDIALNNYFTKLKPKVKKED